LCRPKNKGGLGLQDPQVTNDAYGEKLWWRWVKDSSVPWVKLWKEKYTPGVNPQEMIRFMGTGEGSTIWNLAWRNKKWIQGHSFWEIRNGRTTRFWEDAWQQEPRMENQDKEVIKQEMIGQGKMKVYQYWKQREENARWRIWDNIQPQNRAQEGPMVKEIEEELGKRKIWVSEEEDQLIWGRKNGGEFNLKEARHYIAGQDQENPEPHWERLWNYPQWTKIKMFKWLILHKKILTWENLTKRGFNGPSRCHLCEIQEETTDHLLDECNYTTEIWDWVAIIYRQSNRVRGDIRATIKTGRRGIAIMRWLTCAWGLTSGMVIWAIWKERNRRIFRNESQPTSRIKDIIITQIRETVQSLNLNNSKNHLRPRSKNFGNVSFERMEP
jgi:hypothetical protein